MSDKEQIQFTLAQTLAKAMTEVYNAKTRFEVLALEKHVAGNTKHILRNMIVGLRNVLDQLTDRLGLDSEKIIRESMLNDEQTLQLENITSMFVSLPPGIRDQIELYVSAYYKAYAQKETNSLITS